MIVKVKKAKEVEQINEFGIVTGMLLMTLISYIANKFYTPAKEEMSAAGKVLDTSSDKLVRAVEAEGTIEARNLAQKIAKEKQKFAARIQQIKQQATDANTVADMPEKPSVMISNEITKYQNTLEMLKLSVKTLKPTSRRAFATAKTEISNANNLIKNIDQLMLLLNRKDPSGLWRSGVSQSALAPILKTDKDWKAFVNVIYKNYIK